MSGFFVSIRRIGEGRKSGLNKTRQADLGVNTE